MKPDLEYLAYTSICTWPKMASDACLSNIDDFRKFGHSWRGQFQLQSSVLWQFIRTPQLPIARHNCTGAAFITAEIWQAKLVKNRKNAKNRSTSEACSSAQERKFKNLRIQVFHLESFYSSEKKKFPQQHFRPSTCHKAAVRARIRQKGVFRGL